MKMESSSPEFRSKHAKEDVVQEKEFWYWWARKVFFQSMNKHNFVAIFSKETGFTKKKKNN